MTQDTLREMLLMIDTILHSLQAQVFELQRIKAELESEIVWRTEEIIQREA